MNSLGSSSKWPSYDSLPSASSILLSESDQTEDEADIYSEGEGYSGRANSLSTGEGITMSGNYLDFQDQPSEGHTRSKCELIKHSVDEDKRLDLASSPGAATLGSTSATPGDLAFAQKCADLHRFIRPLLILLHGLKTGRFDKGLTSFQQSVAIDRLQRILGILQKPEMGEKYLQNLLQIEMMLKMWFPQVACQATNVQNQTASSKWHNWHQNQLHMPVKKRKLSWSDPVPAKHRHHHHEKHGSCEPLALLCAASTCLPGSPKRRKIPEEETLEASGNSCAARHAFTDSSGALSRPCSGSGKRKHENLKHSHISHTSPRGGPATQDCSVSSSDSATTDDSP